jgi:hypothetical protein
MLGKLPESLNISGKDYNIRSDYRNVLELFQVFNDPELETSDKWIVAIYMFFEDFQDEEDIANAILNDGFSAEEAAKKISWFISGGKDNRNDTRPEPPTFDWEQDEQMIFAAINNVAKKEVREVEYMHWWTFLGYFNEIGDGSFSFIVSIRHKLNHGKKLEKYEREFLNENKDKIILRKKLTEEEQKEEDAYRDMLDEVIG